MDMRQETREGMIFAHPARVLGEVFTDRERLLDLASERAFDPSFLRESTPFFWPAEISSNRLDAYYSRMAPSSLRNYAVEAAVGVGFQNSHDVNKLGFGRSLTGFFQETGATEQDARLEEPFRLSRTVAEFYTVPHLRLHDVSTDDFIAGIRTSLIHNVSIGFYNADWMCSVCGRDLFDWDCPHIPGLMYPRQRAANGEETGEVMAFAWVENAHLAEVSAVYNGATPGAAILKARQQVETGRMPDKAAQLIEARYRVRLGEMRRIWTAGTPAQGGMMDEETRAENLEIQGDSTHVSETVGMDRDEGALRAMLANLGLPDGDLPAQVRALAAEVERLRPLEMRLAEAEHLLSERGAELEAAQVEMSRLRPLATEGENYLAELLAEALAEGVRAMGDDFKRDTYRALLLDADPVVLRQFRDDWRKAARSVFGEGGRITSDQSNQGPGKTHVTPQPDTPDAAFRA